MYFSLYFAWGCLREAASPTKACPGGVSKLAMTIYFAALRLSRETTRPDYEVPRQKAHAVWGRSGSSLVKLWDELRRVMAMRGKPARSTL